MQPDKNNIKNLLNKAKRPILASILEKVWDLPVSEYAYSLWQKKVNLPPMENELKEAFEKEVLRIGIGLNESKVFLNRLEETRVIQTATHLTATEGPTFLALHHLSLSGMPPQETYFVGAYSGVSFTNSAWSGCLNFSNRFDLADVISPKYKGFSDLKRSDSDRMRDSSERRISLIPGDMRNKLVFQSKIPERLVDQSAHFSDPIRKLMPPAKKGNDYSIWATQFCANQLRYIIKDKSIIYFDINEVVRSYLIKVLQKSDHPLHTIFFNSKISEKILGYFPPEVPFFSIEANYKNKFRQESVYLKNGLLFSQNYQIEISLKNILRDLEKGILCPSLFLVFTTLSFLNGLICFGSFEQVEYLADFKRRWLKNDLLDKEVVYSVNVSAFTSGLCLDEEERTISPLDLILGIDWDFNENITIGNLVKPLLSRMGVVI